MSHLCVVVVAVVPCHGVEEVEELLVRPSLLRFLRPQAPLPRSVAEAALMLEKGKSASFHFYEH